MPRETAGVGFFEPGETAFELPQGQGLRCVKRSGLPEPALVQAAQFCRSPTRRSSHPDDRLPDTAKCSAGYLVPHLSGSLLLGLFEVELSSGPVGGAATAFPATVTQPHATSSSRPLCRPERSSLEDMGTNWAAQTPKGNPPLTPSPAQHKNASPAVKNARLVPWQAHRRAAEGGKPFCPITLQTL